MNEQNNTAVVQRVYDAFNWGRPTTVLANVAPSAEWIEYGPSTVPYFGNFSGRIEEFFRAIGDSVTDGSVAIDQYISSGDTVVTRERWIAQVRHGGEDECGPDPFLHGARRQNHELEWLRRYSRSSVGAYG